MDQDGPADGMADEDRAVVQPVEQVEQRALPGPIVRVGVVRHSRIEDSVARAELAREASEQLVVPRVVHGLSGALNEQNLNRHLTGLHWRDSAFRERSFCRYRNPATALPEPDIPGVRWNCEAVATVIAESRRASAAWPFSDYPGVSQTDGGENGF